jgi:two-component system sensor histidine kinase YesM
MTLQPIIENAVKHGLEASDWPGKLRICAERGEDSLTITVADNGIGMNEERLAKLKKSLRIEEMTDNGASSVTMTEDGGSHGVVPVSPRDGGGIGMINLQRRLKLMFGEGYGISVESSPLKGTRVRIRLPLPEKNEVRDEHSSR